MTKLSPMRVMAHNREQAEYLIRSRAEQRRVTLSSLEVADGGAGSWLVSVTVDDADTAAAAQLIEDTRVLHLGVNAGSATDK
jgi:hypothetical protein